MSKNSIVKSGGNVLAALTPIDNLITSVSDIVTTWKKENEITNRVDIQARAYVECEREKTKRIIGEQDIELKKFLARLEAELRKDSMELEKFKFKFNIKEGQMENSHEFNMKAMEHKSKIIDGLLKQLENNNENLKNDMKYLELHRVLISEIVKCV